ncbi:MAG TPA: DUF1345 domain-containing protein [Sphingobium sp.]|nr:DUF1345 domain-containing protein [Sphingobium sp.]
MFLLLCFTALPLMAVMPSDLALMAGFDLAALAFVGSLGSLYRHDQARMRSHARENDANRVVMLVVTVIVLLVLMVLIASELAQRQAPSAPMIALILATLALAWVFSNIVYALHYAYLYYSSDADGRDRRGIDFPGTDEPDYWDFTYFAFTLGMTFQTSDTGISSRAVRQTVTFHCLAAFVFNLGILAFTINVLGGG